MLKSVRSKAEQKFMETQKKDKQALKDKEKAWQEKTAHIAKLRALRLEKEAADKEAAEASAAEEASGKTRKSSALPQRGH